MTTSTLLTVNLNVKEAGKLVPKTYYTYLNYLTPEEREKICNFAKSTWNWKLNFTLIGFYACGLLTRKMKLPMIKQVPLGGLPAGLLGAGLGYLIASNAANNSIRNFTNQTVKHAQFVPLWSSPRRAVNPDRVYFELKDQVDDIHAQAQDSHSHAHDSPQDSLILLHYGLYTLAYEELQKQQKRSYLTTSLAPLMSINTHQQASTDSKPLMVSNRQHHC